MSGNSEIASKYASMLQSDYGTQIGYRGPFAVSEGSAFTFYFVDERYAEQDVGAPLPIMLVSSSGDVEELHGLSPAWFKVADEIPDAWGGE